jgi:hypothetical protein
MGESDQEMVTYTRQGLLQVLSMLGYHFEAAEE